MALTLFHTPGTRSVRALWLLEEMATPYDLRTLQYDGAYFASEAFRQINPMGKVPALYDDGTLIIESTAIMQYILHRYGPSDLAIAAEDPEYAAYVQWFHMAESGMANYVAVSFGHSSRQDPYRVSEEFDGYCRHQMEKALGMLEMQLEGREFLLDRGFCAADISLGYTLFFAAVCTGTSYSERVSRYLRRLLARPALQRALSDLPADQLASIG